MSAVVEEDVVESAGDYQSNYVRCRLMGHLWDDTYVAHENDAPIVHGGVRFDARCERCAEVKITIRARGNLRYVLYRRYIYPPSYRLSGEVTRDNLWDEYLIRRENGELAIARKPRKPRVLASVS